MAVTTGRHAVAGLEYFVEITEIVVSHMQADICHSEGSIPEQVGCLVQSFFLEQILVIFSCQPLDDAAQPIEIIAQFLGQRGQFPVAVVLLDILEHCEQQLLLIIFLSDLSLVNVIHELQKEQAHGDLVGTALVGLFVVQRPNEIFHKVLDRQDIRSFKVKIMDILAAVLQTLDDKGAQHIVLCADHTKGLAEKFRQDDKINGNVVISRGVYFLGGSLA